MHLARKRVSQEWRCCSNTRSSQPWSHHPSPSRSRTRRLQINMTRSGISSHWKTTGYREPYGCTEYWCSSPHTHPTRSWGRATKLVWNRVLYACWRESYLLNSILYSSAVQCMVTIILAADQSDPSPTSRNRRRQVGLHRPADTVT